MWSNFLNNSNIVYIKESLEYFDKGYHTIENVLNWVYSFYQVLIQFFKKKNESQVFWRFTKMEKEIKTVNFNVLLQNRS